MEPVEVLQDQIDCADAPQAILSRGAGPCFLVGCFNKAIRRGYLMHDPNPSNGPIDDFFDMIHGDDPAPADLLFVLAGGQDIGDEITALQFDYEDDEGVEDEGTPADPEEDIVFDEQDEREAKRLHAEKRDGELKAILEGIDACFPGARVEQVWDEPTWTAGMVINTQIGRITVVKTNDHGDGEEKEFYRQA